MRRALYILLGLAIALLLYLAYPSFLAFIGQSPAQPRVVVRADFAAYQAAILTYWVDHDSFVPGASNLKPMLEPPLDDFIDPYSPDESPYQQLWMENSAVFISVGDNGVMDSILGEDSVSFRGDDKGTLIYLSDGNLERQNYNDR